MKLLLVVLSLRWAEGYYTPIRDPDTLHALFGDLADMSDLRLPPPGQKPLIGHFNDTDDEEGPDLKAMFKPIDDLLEANHNISNDVNDFNAITKRLAATKMEFHNASYQKEMEELHARRVFAKRDWEESYGYFFYYEHAKIQKLKKLALGFLIHTRFKCDGAIRQRRNSRRFRAYKMGYIFNRLRRIQYNQMKIINAAQIHFDEHKRKYAEYKNLHTQLIRMYEKVIRLDVDMRDLIDLVYAVYAAKDPVVSQDPSSESSDDD